MIALYIIVAYVLVIFAMNLWESLMGFGPDWDGYDSPPFAAAAAFWPISLPILIIWNLARWFEYLKKQREKRERIERDKKEKDEAQRARLAKVVAQQEELRMKKVEEELIAEIKKKDNFLAQAEKEIALMGSQYK